MENKSKNYFLIVGIILCSLSALIVILRYFGIAVLPEPSSAFWTIFAVSAVSFIILMCRKANKKNVVLFIAGLFIYFFMFFVSLFKVGTIGGTEHFNTISSDDGKHTVVVHEFQRPIHSGFAIYRKVFLNVYICEHWTDVRTGYFPFENGDCKYEWDNDTLNISFRRDENVGYETVTIVF
ncbi:hypothetical protein [Ruminococcus albus]|uniref:Uncharacterized protein n=1 Tax=Ruminococcus albus TaxID=1264 RepID=A0A1I1KNM7_RUMAL|nr:hypothetical protein [Ruminococcus albus]SFC59733.1 hypothetical protein SAMN02910406_02000 [Ruminococcus albus]